MTIYHGDKLPPLYVGSTTSERLSSGYHGSVRSQEFGATWKHELESRPNLFETHEISKHATRQEALDEEETLQRLFDAVKSDAFINMAYARGGFINKGYWTEEERAKMRKPHKISEDGKKRQLERAARNIGRKNTPETIEKMRLAALNRKKAPPVTAETRAKLSASITAAHAKRKAAKSAQKQSEGA